MASTNRVGRVSSIDYESGTYEVTYADRGKTVTARINAISNGEYRMPRVGQIVSVCHTSNGTAAGTTTGTVWNKSNKPAEGFAGLYRKEYGTAAGQAYERYDANTGVYTQFTDQRTGRNCNGDIFDEAKGTISLIAEKLVQITSRIKSVSIRGKEGVGIGAEKSVSIDAGENISLEAGGDLDEGVGGDRALTVGGKNTELFEGETERELRGAVKETVTGEVTLNINGVSITIGAGGDITIRSSGKINVTAQEIYMAGSSSTLTL